MRHFYQMTFQLFFFFAKTSDKNSYTLLLCYGIVKVTEYFYGGKFCLNFRISIIIFEFDTGCRQISFYRQLHFDIYLHELILSIFCGCLPNLPLLGRRLLVLNHELLFGCYFYISLGSVTHSFQVDAEDASCFPIFQSSDS